MTSITELEDKANKVANLMFEKFNDTIKRNIENIDLYSNTFKNKVYIEELLNIYKNKNDNLKQQITNIKSTIFTDDRKTYYQKQNLVLLQSWYNLLKWIYIFSVLVLIVLCFIKKYSWTKIIVIFLLFCVYPFIINLLIFLCILISKKITWMLPKNVYLHT
jgi:hypothetical protein